MSTHYGTPPAQLIRRVGQFTRSRGLQKCPMTLTWSAICRPRTPPPGADAFETYSLRVCRQKGRIEMTLDCFATNPELNPVAWITSCPVPGKWQCVTHRDTSPIKPDQIPPSLGPGGRAHPSCPVIWP